MSFLSALFGGHRGAAAAAEKPAEPVEYKGFVIRAAPFKNEGQYQTAGSIEREMILGTIGEGASIEFGAYLRTARELPFPPLRLRSGSG